MSRFLHFNRVSFSYPSMADPLLSGVEVFFPEGSWTGIVGANGAGKTTLLRLAAGELEPSEGHIQQIGTAAYVVQRTDEPPEGWIDFLDSYDSDAIAWRVRLGVQSEWAERWDTLSHGERKRLQIALALWNAPDVLALDEPTNHLDVEARETLLRALKLYRGVGLLVSHDRALLDSLCEQCLFVFPPNATLRPGGVTQGLGQVRLEQSSARDRDNELRDASRRLRAQAQSRRETAEQMAAKHKAGTKKLPLHDHDGRAKRQLAKLTGKDSWAVNQSASLAKRAGKAEASRKGLPLRKEYEMGFWLEGSSCSKRNCVLQLSAGEIALGEGRVLRFPELCIRPTDRVALTGLNGSGKSSLLRYILPRTNVPEEHLLSIPQEISLEEAKEIHMKAQALPKEVLGNVMTCVSRLGSRPGRLLESQAPSPGEIRKLLLAIGVSQSPHLIILDEPTNHLDLPSIECLEEALSECPCALLIVSHDAHFLQTLTTIEWHLAEDADGNVELTVE